MTSSAPLWCTAALLLIAADAAQASCKDPDWAHWDFSKPLNPRFAKVFADYADATPIFVRGQVVSANRTRDNLWAFDDKANYEIRVRLLEVYKGSYHFSSFTVAYPLRAQKPKMATPFVGEQWIFAIQKLHGEAAVISTPVCGGLGFPVTQKRLLELLAVRLQASHPAVKLDQPCKSDAQCRAVDCSKYDNPIKSGYRAACVDERPGQSTVCRCMCFGCK